jgi:hypothetical protein
MLDPVPIPIQEAVHTSLTDLLGRGVAATKRALSYDDDLPIVGRYLDHDGATAALVVSDLEFLRTRCCALAMIPGGGR